jgi:hypothetical protein
MVGMEGTMRLILLALLLAAPLCAAELKVGDDAPPFKAGGDLINPPEFARTLDDCKGDVIVIMEWCIGDPKMRRLPDLQKRWEQYGENGLMVFAVHRLDHHKLPQVRAYCRGEKLTLPVAMGGFYDEKNSFGKYSGESGFWTTIVDVDGKVAFFSKEDFLAALDKELARIVYPKLGKHAVAKEAERACGKLKGREYGEALVEADKALGLNPPEAAKQDLEHLKETVTTLAEQRLARVEEWKTSKRWDLVVAALEQMKGQYKGHKFGDDARAELKTLERDKAVKKELEAFQTLERQMQKSATQQPQIIVNGLRAFARANKGMGAADYAEALAKEREAELAD